MNCGFRSLSLISAFLTFATVNPSNKQTYNVGLLMVQKSATNRFDLVHIGPAIDIAIQVSLARCAQCCFFWLIIRSTSVVMTTVFLAIRQIAFD